jgi:hypothetical protein
MTEKRKNEGPLRVPLKFDDAIKRALSVRPPPEGWEQYEKNLRAAKKKQKSSKAKARV